MSNLKKCVSIEKVKDLSSFDYGKYYLLIADKKVFSAWSLVPVVSHALLLYYEDYNDSYYFEERLFDLIKQVAINIYRSELFFGSHFE